MNTAAISIEPVQAEDWPVVQVIYREGIATGNATFETRVPTWEAWDKSHIVNFRFVARIDGQIVGWAALSPVSSRTVYSGVAEVSVYVSEAVRGQGAGTALLSALINESEREGFWTLQAGIFPENAASISMHLGCGFRQVGYRERLGQMNGVWRDVLLLERRSKVVGI